MTGQADLRRPYPGLDDVLGARSTVNGGVASRGVWEQALAVRVVRRADGVSRVTVTTHGRTVARLDVRTYGDWARLGRVLTSPATPFEAGGR